MLDATNIIPSKQNGKKKKLIQEKKVRKELLPPIHFRTQ